MVIRPEHFNVSENNEYSFNPKVDLIDNLGNEKIAYVKIDQYEISAKISSKHNIDNTIGFNYVTSNVSNLRIIFN